MRRCSGGPSARYSQRLRVHAQAGATDLGDGAVLPDGLRGEIMSGLVGLLLAFGLTMAVGRYETRRVLIVQEANTIGTTFLRAQLLPEPERSNRAHE